MLTITDTTGTLTFEPTQTYDDDAFDGPLTEETAKYDADPTGGAPSPYGC